MNSQWKNVIFSALNLLRNYLSAPVIGVLFPSDCPVCLEPLGRYHCRGICLDCWISIKVIKSPFCSICGLPLNEISHAAMNEQRCERCRRNNYSFTYARSPGEYSGTLKEILHLFKFGKNEYLALPLSRLVAKMVGSQLLPGDRILEADVIIPVPLHRKRERRRGFNQSYLIARQLGKKLGIKVEKNVLIRTRDSIPQIELPPEKREKNVRGAFTVKNFSRIKERRILLIDDIFTTGATVSECAKVLKCAGAREVIVFTIAHTPFSHR